MSYPYRLCETLPRLPHSMRQRLHQVPAQELQPAVELWSSLRQRLHQDQRQRLHRAVELWSSLRQSLHQDQRQRLHRPSRPKLPKSLLSWEKAMPLQQRVRSDRD